MVSSQEYGIDFDPLQTQFLMTLGTLKHIVKQKLLAVYAGTFNDALTVPHLLSPPCPFFIQAVICSSTDYFQFSSLPYVFNLSVGTKNIISNRVS
jgi:hypothetical protein